MRTIKFRAYRNDPVVPKNSRMRDWEDIMSWTMLNLAKPGDLIYMQFIGLLDRNHHEIYEGDILRAPKGSIVKIVYQVKDGWQVPGFAAVAPNGDTERNIYHYASYGEVVGNIYENPELLTS